MHVELEQCDQAVAPNQELAVQVAELKAKIKLLPLEQRRALIDLALNAKGYAAIAASHNVSIGTIKSRIARGRETLRKWREDIDQRQINSAASTSIDPWTLCMNAVETLVRRGITRINDGTLARETGQPVESVTDFLDDNPRFTINYCIER